MASSATGARPMVEPRSRLCRLQNDREHGAAVVSLGRTRRSERGAALVELAVALPLLAVIMVGAIDFGRAFRTAMIVTNAARAGALYGQHSQPNAGSTTGMRDAANAVLIANGLGIHQPRALQKRVSAPTRPERSARQWPATRRAPAGNTSWRQSRSPQHARFR